ncbi:hypothetical protein ALP42_200078 [Pseudomonas savastanoi pv. nerii]|uniref:Uncharacterized protein n=1 Tax=Pseudomonas savastanoi pv. nerii TaxID=360921 RepID=A0AB74BAJ2_PSESS|nr:hypothetical protein ALP42_200078 [Pseudomonas savastanoi pv. nerii]
MQRSQTETIGLVLNGEALVVRFCPFSLSTPYASVVEPFMSDRQLMSNCRSRNSSQP